MSHLNLNSLLPSSFLSDSKIPHTLGEEFSLCDKGNVVFHWADFHETCDVIKAKLETDSSLSDDFKSRESSISKLQNIPVWIRTKSKVHQSSMHELYEKFLFKQSLALGGLDPFGPLDLSFISGTGPFKFMSMTECFNKDTYRDFVLVNLLRGKLPKRDFRIRLKAKVLMEYGLNFEKAGLIHIEQLTTQGMLLSMDSDLFSKEITSSKKMRILIDSQVLELARGMGLPELNDHFSQYAFNLMYSSKKEDAFEFALSDFSLQSSFDYIKNKKVFLFGSYKNMKAFEPSHKDRLVNFVGSTRDLVRDHFLGHVKKSA